MLRLQRNDFTPLQQNAEPLAGLNMAKKGSMETVLAFATVALASATVVLAFATFKLVSESRQASYRQIGIQTWLEFQKRFDSAEMLRARKKLAMQLKSYDPAKNDTVSETVLNFFDDMGSVYEAECLDKKLAISSFSFHASRWWEAAKPYVDQERRRHGDDKTIFDKFEYVAGQMRLPGEKIDDKELRQFLDDESRLTSD